MAKVLKKKVSKTKKPVKAKSKPIKKLIVAPKKIVATSSKVQAKKCDVCQQKGPVTATFSHNICLDCYLLLEPYFDNIVQEFKNEGKDVP